MSFNGVGYKDEGTGINEILPMTTGAKPKSYLSHERYCCLVDLPSMGTRLDSLCIFEGFEGIKDTSNL